MAPARQQTAVEQRGDNAGDHQWRDKRVIIRDFEDDGDRGDRRFISEPVPRMLAATAVAVAFSLKEGYLPFSHHPPFVFVLP